MNVTDNIKAIREAKKISQAYVASALNMERANYYRLEHRGNKLTIEQLSAIAGALGVSVVELFTGEEPLEKNKPDELTLRDQFALAALPAIITKYGMIPIVGQLAYQAADYMLEAHTKAKGDES